MKKLTLSSHCNGSGMAQHEPVTRIAALYRNGWPGRATSASGHILLAKSVDSPPE
jgi:hypothetical protein